jgi:hypothetical protein
MELELRVVGERDAVTRIQLDYCVALSCVTSLPDSQ